MKRFSACAALALSLMLCWAGPTPAASAAGGTDVAGKYTLVSSGYKGTMTIKRMGPGFVFRFKTMSLANGQMCDFETYETPIDQGGGRTDDTRPAHGGTADDGIKFDISFSGNTATVDVLSRGDECGMSGTFEGKYVKAGK